ncbi:MAG: BMC domain-containing protein [Christensenellaceae bacterium]|nr:BMC domain-containing protein [Christensenellaceae bacterium]
MNALGMIELNSIPKGIEAADAMLKAADVRLDTAQAVCAGKYIAVVSGDVAAVKASVDAGKEIAAEKLIDSIVIPNVHPQVISAISACTEIDGLGAVGIMEVFSLSAAVVIADAAVKAADVDLMEIRLGRGLGGKAFIILTGDVAACKAAVSAGESVEEARGLLSESVVIPSPHADLFAALV